MASKNRMASNGQYPSDAKTAYGIQSKAVFKYTQYLIYLRPLNIEILIYTGVEALKG
jgi:hypothetical protein